MCNLTESEIIELAAKTAIDCYKSQEAKNKKQLNDKRLRNTKLLLANYRSFKTHSDSAVYTAEQAEDAIEILDLMWDPNNKSASVVESIKASCAKTVIIVNHIDTMIEAYRTICYNSQNPIEKRRFDVLYDKYIAPVDKDNPELTNLELADKYCVDERTIYNDLKYAVSRVAKLIFGIDFITGNRQ